ncbi:SagB family peptide dehydrogenase [Saliphagus sp. LR7]|uniref:SagB family peptide dehydrogenase n=1 Tax=Saliphagus sp. LR7 TaxID=2282654 RepID=UPI000DF7F170|nr:SagB family peptide dehydrogenase [Saliphagus sp. LR7]
MVDALEYHGETNHSPREIRNADFSLDPRTKPRPYKVYEDLPRVELPSIRPPQGPALDVISESRADPVTDAADGPEEFGREALATLCYEASGVIREITTSDGREMAFRAASCTGKLYHVDLYAVCGDLADLAAGVYHFDPSRMALDVLREGDFRGIVANAVGGGGDGSSGVADAPVTFVATSTWWRNAWKYRERTYRHAFWDSGTVLANLLAAAHATDWRAEVVAAFADDPIAELVGVDPGKEAPIALAPIGNGDPVPDPHPVEPIDPTTEPLSSDCEEYPLIGEAWGASTLTDGNAAGKWRRRVRDAISGRRFGSQTEGDEDRERIALDPVDSETASARPLHATIRRRGSCREYAREGPSRRQVGTILDRATRGIPADWNAGAGNGLAFNDLHVLTTGVSGIPDGSYRYRSDEDVLERAAEIDREEKARLALDQSWAGDAHVNVYLLADVEGIVEEFGNRGYRLAQLEAGLTLGRLYLATYAHRELGGLGLTFYDDFASEKLAQGERTPTCLFAFGKRGD